MGGCNSYCKTCDIDTCKECNSGFGKTGKDSCETCPASGRYLNGVNCESCIAYCETCNDGSSCTKCASYYSVKDNICVVCPTDLGGWYISGNYCYACPSTCSRCTSSSVCLSCNSGYGLQSNMCSTCPTGTYLIAQLCKTCPTNCSECSSGTVCTNCKSGFGLQSNNCSTCPSSTYLDGQNCVTCPTNCATCSSASICLTCQSGFGLQSNQCSTCPSDTYLSGQICVACPETCSTCTSDIFCTNCKSGYALQSNMCSSCPSETYLSTAQTCLTCPNTCSDCTSDTVCTNCLAGYGLQNNNQCATCPTGTFLSGQNCQTCPSTCSSCTSSSNCQQCRSGYGLQSNNQCTTCPSATYLNGQDCLSCPTNCAICTDSLTCTSCVSGYELKNNQCSSCANGTYIASGGFCQTCPVKCSACTDASTCTACKDGYAMIGSMCDDCPSGTYYSAGVCVQESQYSNTTKEVIQKGKTARTAAAQVATLLSRGNPLGVSAGMSGQLFSDIKYLNITYSDELQEALLTWNSDFISFDWDAPEALGRSLQSALPYNFAKYNVKTSFLVNNWQNIMLLLIFVAIFLMVRGLQWAIKSKENKFSWAVRTLKVFVQNFLLGQLYQNYGEFVLFSILDWRSDRTRFSSLNLAISSAMAVVIIIHLVLHFKLLRDYQKIRVTNDKEQLEAFQKKHEGSQFLFRDFKDDSLNQQLFLFYMIVRDLLFSLTLATLFEFPIVQTWILLTMNISMLVYLLIKRPFREYDDFAQQLINELITLIVVISVFIQAVMDYGSSKGNRVRLGKLIIICNIIFNYITLLFMAYKLLLLAKEGYKAYKEYKEMKAKKAKVHHMNDSMAAGQSTQPSQMSMISHIPKRPSIQAEESFFSGLHEDLAHQEFKNPKAPRNKADHTNVPMDESNLQSISLETETERPLVFTRRSTLKFMKPAQKQLYGNPQSQESFSQ